MGDHAFSEASTSSSRPSAHAQRYDRQLRLWASSGQTSLESANVLVLGASSLAACVLKNLILPGIGSFTIVDENVVTEADVGNNFFIEDNAKGRRRAKEVVKNLCELNPSVKGTALVQAPMGFAGLEDIDQYSLVITINQPNRVLFYISERAWKARGGKGIPVLAVRGAGFVGEVQLQIKEAAIVETHPDSIIDMRLTRPWPALQAYAAGYKVDEIDTMEQSHIPFIVVLLRALERWKKDHEGRFPNPSSDRKRFTETINAFRRPNNSDEENIDEAIGALGQHVWRPISSGEEGKVPANVQALLDDEACEKVTKESTNFWLLVRALRSFVQQGDGCLPLSGSLPDMKALSATYIQLQRIYREKAAEDVINLKKYLHEVLQQVGLPKDTISADEIESFAKHAGFLYLLQGRRLMEIDKSPNLENIVAGLKDPINPCVVQHHLAMLAARKFYEMHNCRYPGSSYIMTELIVGGGMAPTSDDTSVISSTSSKFDFDDDLGEMIQLAEDLLVMIGDYDLEGQNAVVDACREITRSGHADLPSTSAVLGGIAAQEAIKIITNQYIPINNTVVYDGIKQAMGVFTL